MLIEICPPTRRKRHALSLGESACLHGTQFSAMGYAGGKGVLRHAGAGFLPAIVGVLYQPKHVLSRRKRDTCLIT